MHCQIAQRIPQRVDVEMDYHIRAYALNKRAHELLPRSFCCCNGCQGSCVVQLAAKRVDGGEFHRKLTRGWRGYDYERRVDDWTDGGRVGALNSPKVF